MPALKARAEPARHTCHLELTLANLHVQAGLLSMCWNEIRSALLDEFLDLAKYAVIVCCRQVMSGASPAGFEEYIPKNHPCLTAPMMPDSSSVYNFTFNKNRAEWQAWSDTLAPATIPAGSDFSDIIVPTQDSARYTFLLDTALRHAQPILFVGPTGCCCHHPFVKAPRDASQSCHAFTYTEMRCVEASYPLVVACIGDEC